MGVINIPRGEQDALQEVDTDVLDELIKQCVAEECPNPLQSLRLESCGAYVASELRTFKKALITYGNAKTAKKRDETKCDALRAGDDLADAVCQMKHRLETEEKEGQLFFVDDQIIHPSFFSERLTLRVGYRWRRTVEDEWVYDSITFSHVADLRGELANSSISKKTTAAKREQKQRELSYQWQYLVSLGLQAVRDYFREGRDGTLIPVTFQVKADRGLNNYSANFWSVKA